MQVMFEVSPPSRRSTKEALASFVEKVKNETRSAHINYFNVPEIIEENHAGMPFYRNADVCEVASLLQRATSIETVVNKVTVHLGSEQELRSWVMGSINNYGIHSFVFVGGNSGLKKYLGPSVTRSNEIASKMKGIKVGNICIPSRSGEAERLVEKTRSGASFFTTQLIFESSTMNGMLSEYESRCGDLGISPASFFISFAPAASPLDIDFLKWLGARIPNKTEQRLSRSRDMESESISVATETFSEIKEFVRKEGIAVPVSVNIEPIHASNLGAAFRLLGSIVSA